MAKIADPIAIRHPKIPGEIHVVSRVAFPAYEAVGWVEAKSSEAKSAVEASTPSKED